jgi:hypothetical protein
MAARTAAAMAAMAARTRTVPAVDEVSLDDTPILVRAQPDLPG